MIEVDHRGYKVKVQVVQDGLHPSEVVVAVQTEIGLKHISICRRSLNADHTVDIGFPVSARCTTGSSKMYYLIELPREFDDGAHRVWVEKDQIEQYPFLEALR